MIPTILVERVVRRLIELAPDVLERALVESGAGKVRFSTNPKRFLGALNRKPCERPRDYFLTFLPPSDRSWRREA